MIEVHYEGASRCALLSHIHKLQSPYNTLYDFKLFFANMVKHW